ncbi:glycine cleavage system protein GcvH [Desulforamulus ruminis]|uniref:Glycine cleavage system H protein n=1 Tax=Desulforamulus ruminis (strain ATCC 23193 / DSM 2154 / NCIMB 8452 / DL) TaxID=696281 RepID=F6DNZ5_DESRL|nr:glycine cleavage system protein GcvH [Desulforamulus ruminis]AEG60714.1 glycine cleavage system H protein [Desulforamulus ruminis DSM 2154]
MKKFSKEHQWIEVAGDKGRMGITKYAAEQLGDIVYLELPSVGEQTTAGEPMALVESVKSTSDIYAPVSGEVLEVNEALGDAPELLNGNPEGDAWIAKLKLDHPGELDDLMTEEEYLAFVKEAN